MIARYQDSKYIRIHPESMQELEQMNIYFTRKLKNAVFRKGKNNKWDGQISFFKNDKLLPIGLWQELMVMCKECKFPLTFQNFKSNVFREVDKEEVAHFCKSIMRNYQKVKEEFDTEGEQFQDQIDAVYKAVKYRYCVENLSTALGKSLIIYMYTLYMLYKKWVTKMLITTIDPYLVMQLYGDFNDYNVGGHIDLNMGMITGDVKNHEGKRIIMGNPQTLQHVDDEFFRRFDGLISDEVHRSGSKTMLRIIRECKNAESRFGVTGTYRKDNFADSMTILANFGPVVKTIKKKETMDKGYTSKIEIRQYVLDWATKDERLTLAKKKWDAKNDRISYDQVFRFEQNMIRTSVSRADWVADFITKLKGNVIIFFLDVEGGYGKYVMSLCRKKDKRNDYYYIDGDVDTKLREAYKDKMESHDGIRIFATYPTFSTGKNVKRVHHLVAIESAKGYELIGQAQGRGMRKHFSKDGYVWHEIHDDISCNDVDYPNPKNYSLKHLMVKSSNYKDEGFDYKRSKYTISDQVNTLF